ncbi:zinc finger, C3HC4 type (RING finger) protein [Medicago truncatula]|uniref:Zinc finger, C3HC4 type (RING finger) protein n=1 Tax=Medicago truncatula TaxID=3880 RepID=A0A072VHY1_MEDTR|nr:zinc finger, C3HC4 type (RING finger) protein [Medicago truncatula]
MYNICNYESIPDSEKDVECVVCLCKIEEGDDIRVLKCDHMYHRHCLDKWVAFKNHTCPLCRESLRPERVIIENHCREYYNPFSVLGLDLSSPERWMKSLHHDNLDQEQQPKNLFIITTTTTNNNLHNPDKRLNPSSTKSNEKPKTIPFQLTNKNQSKNNKNKKATIVSNGRRQIDDNGDEKEMVEEKSMMLMTRRKRYSDEEEIRRERESRDMWLSFESC